MSPSKVDRRFLNKLTDLPNIGISIAGDLQQLGIYSPQDLVGRDPYAMHAELNAITKIQHDPCIIDVFISVTRFMAGEAPRPWWDYSSERKHFLTCQDHALIQI